MAAQAGCVDNSGKPPTLANNAPANDTQLGPNLHVIDGGVHLPDDMVRGK
jgi:hypothetical protein